MQIIEVTLTVVVETTKSLEEVKSGIKRGIYRGLDTEPYYIAKPSNVEVIWLENPEEQ